MDALYTKALMRLAADAAGAGRLDRADAAASTQSTMCGDRIHVDLRLNGGAVTAFAHDTKACVLTQASISLLASHASGLTADDLAHGAETVSAWLSGGPTPPAPFDQWSVFEALRDHPARWSCVLLPFKAVALALKGDPT